MGAGNKLGVRDFGDRLITTRDLDPAYVGLHGARLETDQLSRWLLAYWCFYHVGLASWLSENIGQSYWKWMRIAAENVVAPPNSRYERWPRAPERRHFRGQKCVDAVDWLSNGPPEYYVQQFTAPSDHGSERQWTDKIIMERVQKWPLFGPWIAFKAADMLERVCGVQVKFDANLGLMYEEPRKALKLLASKKEVFRTAEQKASNPSTSTEEMVTWNEQEWYNALSMYFRAKLAPPANDRVCGPQEVETVLCKWKSYMGGHYHLGKDITDHRRALDGWGATADRVKVAMPEEVM